MILVCCASIHEPSWLRQDHLMTSRCDIGSTQQYWLGLSISCGLRLLTHNIHQNRGDWSLMRMKTRTALSITARVQRVALTRCRWRWKSELLLLVDITTRYETLRLSIIAPRAHHGLRGELLPNLDKLSCAESARIDPLRRSCMSLSSHWLERTHKCLLVMIAAR